jgi:hypothetical protein
MMQSTPSKPERVVMRTQKTPTRFKPNLARIRIRKTKVRLNPKAVDVKPVLRIRDVYPGS